MSKNRGVRVRIITGSLVTLENLFLEKYRHRYRLEIRMNFHYRYRLGVRSRPFMAIDSQLPSWKSFEFISSKLPLPLPSWNSETKNQPKDRSFRPDVPADIRQKTSVRPSKSWKNKHFGTDMPRGRPRKNFGLKNFGLIFRSLEMFLI